MKNYLSSDNIYLSALSMVHKRSITEWYNNSRVLQRYTLKVLPTNETRIEEELNNYYKDNSNIYFGIFIKSNDEFIGVCSLNNIDFISKFCNINFIIGVENHFDKGYEYDAVKLMLKYGFNSLGLHRVSYINAEFNNDIINYLVNEIGFTKEVVQREALFSDGNFHDLITLGILQDEYQPKKLGAE